MNSIVAKLFIVNKGFIDFHRFKVYYHPMNGWIYRNSSNNRSRYLLGEEGNNPLICIGVNPSTAKPGELDNTMRVVKSRALSLGYDSWLMINLYPQRSTDPNKLHKRIDLNIHRENIKIIKEVCSHNYDIWAAWGALIEKREYLIRCLKDIHESLGSNKVFTIGKRSVAGHPHHPLYLKKGLSVDHFSITSYIESIS